MATIKPITVKVRAMVPHLMRAALRVAARPCQCRGRQRCAPCTLQAATARDMRAMRKRHAEQFTGKRA